MIVSDLEEGDVFVDSRHPDFKLKYTGLDDGLGNSVVENEAGVLFRLLSKTEVTKLCEKKTKVIGLYGRARAGKDTVGNHLSKIGYLRVSYADRLKEICSRITELPLKIFYDDELKDKEMDIFIHGSAVTCTPRDFLIAYGTGFLRKLDEDFWIKQAFKNKQNLQMVFTDVRFTNEAEGIKDHGGILIHIKRKNFKTPSDNPLSEGLLDNYDKFDYTVEAESVGELLSKIDEIMNEVE